MPAHSAKSGPSHAGGVARRGGPLCSRGVIGRFSAVYVSFQRAPEVARPLGLMGERRFMTRSGHGGGTVGCAKSPYEPLETGTASGRFAPPTALAHALTVRCSAQNSAAPGW